MKSNKIIAVIIVLFTIFALSLTSAGSNVFSVEINKNGEFISVGDVSIIYSPDYIEAQGDGDYEIRIIAYNSSILYSNRFSFPSTLSNVPPLPGEEDQGSINPPIPESSSTVIFVPFFTDAKSIEIYSNSNKVSEGDISALTNKCGNGICESYEDQSSCALDCKPAVTTQNTSSNTQPNTKTPTGDAYPPISKDSNPKSDIMFNLLLLGILVIIGLLIFLITKFRKEI